MKCRVSASGILKKLGVSRSGYSAWKRHIPSNAEIHRNQVKEKIMEIYDTSHQNYGTPKITMELQRAGESISEKTVGNYICQIGIKAQWIKPYIQTTINSDFRDQLKNILNEEVHPE